MSDTTQAQAAALALESHADLSSLHTMALPATAQWLYPLHDLTELSQLMCFVDTSDLPFAVVGGGSNILFEGCYQGLIILMRNKGVEVMCEDDTLITVKVQAGEDWDTFLQMALDNRWYGLENLAIIPGTVGAAPVQNIGAYGQEVADCIAEVYCFDTHTREHVVIGQEDCHFSYRDSIFKTQQRGRYIITAVAFCFSKKLQANLSYQPLSDAMQGEKVTANAIRSAVIGIRQSKLPSPALIANTGSFFKNPVITEALFNQLKQQYPSMPAFFVGDAVKLAAGWLIDQCGWKGRNLGPVGMYSKQALVLVNHGGGTFADVQALSTQIQQDVWKKFAVKLEREPVLIR